MLKMLNFKSFIEFPKIKNPNAIIIIGVVIIDAIHSQSTIALSIESFLILYG